MCGRFTIQLDAIEFENELQLGEMPADWPARYNVAPAQDIPVVIDAMKRDVTLMRWGLVPSWAKDIAIGNRMINARAETIAEKPAFHKAFAQRRCLVLADGFFEWKRATLKGEASIPYYFYLKGHRPFAFAGLWENWKSPDGNTLQSCAIITCVANGVVLPVHDRMPVILTGDDCWNWLAPQPAASLSGYLKPFPDENMDGHIVSRLVNSPGVDSPDCILPVAG